MPMYFLPHIDFSPQLPSCCNSLVSVSAISGNCKSWASENFFCVDALSLLTPMIL